jgi:hypothetical protein
MLVVIGLLLAPLVIKRSFIIDILSKYAATSDTLWTLVHCALCQGFWLFLLVYPWFDFNASFTVQYTVIIVLCSITVGVSSYVLDKMLSILELLETNKMLHNSKTIKDTHVTPSD